MCDWRLEEKYTSMWMWIIYLWVVKLYKLLIFLFTPYYTFQIFYNGLLLLLEYGKNQQYFSVNKC